MNHVFHHAEPFYESGSTYGNSAQKALGRPNLDRWEMFTRETLQNSWDARDRSSHDDGVTFSIEYRVLREEASRILQSFFGNDFIGLEALQRYLQKEKLSALVVSDTGTSGLQGPTSAATHVTTRDDFVSFIRNIGRDSTKKLAGGTYGFGKGVFFDVSRCKTVLVYTRTVDESGRPSNRFIAMSNGEAFAYKGSNFTGRHWWGIKAEGTRGVPYAEPFTGEEADLLARVFELDKYFSAEQPKGTTFMILDPSFESDSPKESMETIAKSLAKWAWPHLVARHSDMDPIHFNVTYENEPIEIPDPLNDPGLAHIVRAYLHALESPEPKSADNAIADWSGEGKRKTVDIISRSPKEYLGKLTIEPLLFDTQESDIAALDLSNHIALMRNPRMIVQYWEGPKVKTTAGYGGVFIASSDLDPLFAASEPPAHDEWNPKSVDLNDPRFFQEGKNKARRANPVNVAITRMKDKLKDSFSPAIAQTTAKSNTAINELSDILGDHFTSTAGKSSKISVSTSSSARTPASKLSRPRKGIKTSDGFVRLVSTPMGTIAIYEVKAALSKQAQHDGATLTVRPYSIVEGKRLFTEEEGVQLPKGIFWFPENPDDIEWAKITLDDIGSFSPDIQLKDIEHWQSYIAFLQPPNTAMSIQVDTELNTQPLSEEPTE